MSEQAPIILIIEDEISIRRFLRTTLSHDGHQIFEASNANQGLDLTVEKHPDIILLDLGLPDMGGLKVIKELRGWFLGSIIVLTAANEEQMKITALDIGADDYLTKPFAIGELKARIRVALRHLKLKQERQQTIFQTGDLKVDLVKRHVWLKDIEISLTPLQYQILTVLIRHAGKVVTHKQLLREVWDISDEDRIDYVRIYLHQLRHKIEENPTCPRYLKNEPGVGYRLQII